MPLLFLVDLNRPNPSEDAVHGFLVVTGFDHQVAPQIGQRPEGTFISSVHAEARMVSAYRRKGPRGSTEPVI